MARTRCPDGMNPMRVEKLASSSGMRYCDEGKEKFSA
jgi:hypothetical protein